MERVSSAVAQSTLSFETGRLAKQADGAVLAQFGDTVVLVAVVGATPVLYHSVATLYLVVLLAAVAVIGLPYLLYIRRGREAWVLFVSLAGVAVLSACYGAYTYLAVHHAATSSAVSIVLGSQSAPGPGGVLKELGPPIVWFGLLGVAALAAGLRYLARPVAGTLNRPR